MQQDIRNIYCVGRNYRKHAAELGNDVPTEPMFFTKPTHAVASINGGEIVLPANSGEIHYEAELVLRMSRTYDERLSIDEMVDSFALGYDFTLRDVQNVIKKKGYPWLPAKGFRNSAAITAWQTNPGVDILEKGYYSMRKNGEEVQHGTIRDMIFDFRAQMQYCHSHFGLGAGDILFTGTPEGVGPVHDGDLLQLFWMDQLVGECTIVLR